MYDRKKMRATRTTSRATVKKERQRRADPSRAQQQNTRNGSRGKGPKARRDGHHTNKEKKGDDTRRKGEREREGGSYSRRAVQQSQAQSRRERRA
mmetsp:Transcript_4382/g.13707  ORF Transcript_4382/g.13707 Transcript_4382/m.13707 type:complete len:95 (+) Transcript_4382:42-326(+)